MHLFGLSFILFLFKLSYGLVSNCVRFCVKKLLCVIDICSKYTWSVLLKIEKLLQSRMHFKTFWISLVVNQTKYNWVWSILATPVLKNVSVD